MIPRLLHLVWFGDVPDAAVTHFWKWRDLMPGWEVKLWDREAVDGLDLINRLPMRYVADSGQASDIARYEILRLFGGFYVDCDVKPFKDLEPFADCGASFVYPDTRWGVSNFFLGAAPGHPIMVAACNQIRRDFPFRQFGPPWSSRSRLDHNFGTTMLETGPWLLRDVAIRFHGRDLPILETPQGRLLGEAGGWRTVLAAWPHLFPHSQRDVGEEAIGLHESWKAWYRNRPPSDDQLSYQRAMDDELRISGLALPDKANVVDVGAYRGLWALTCRRMWPRSRVLAVEPCPDNLAALRLTAAEAGGIEVVEGACGDWEGRVRYEQFPGRPARGRIVAGPAGEVALFRLSALLEGRGWREVDLMRVDCCGWEDEVLADLSSAGTLERVRHLRVVHGSPDCRRLLDDTHHLETLDCGDRLITFATLLKPLGFL